MEKPEKSLYNLIFQAWKVMEMFPRLRAEKVMFPFLQRPLGFKPLQSYAHHILNALHWVTFLSKEHCKKKAYRVNKHLTELTNTLLESNSGIDSRVGSCGTGSSLCR